MSGMSEVHRICTEITENWTQSDFAAVVTYGIPAGIRARLNLESEASNLDAATVIGLFIDFVEESASNPV